MISPDAFKQHVEAAQRGLHNRNLSSWSQLGEIFDAAGRLNLVQHGTFTAKVIWQCRSVLQIVEQVKWESGKLSVEAASIVAALGDLPSHLAGEDFVQLCKVLNKLVKDSYRLRLTAASLPEDFSD
jgi:hypothetical protein